MPLMTGTQRKTVKVLIFLLGVLLISSPDPAIAQFNSSDLISLVGDLPEESCMALAQLEEVMQV